MAKKTKNSQPIAERVNIAIWEQYTLKTKFQKKALVPTEAIDRNWMGIWCYSAADHKVKESAVFVTTDGHKVHIKLLGCENYTKGDDTEWLSTLSESLYGIKFEVLWSNWYARFGDLSGYWHLIEMEEV